MTDTPSAKLVRAATAPISVQDACGRELVLRRMTALDRLRLFKAVGPMLSQNEPYLGMAMLASSVTEIDGVPVPAPVTESQLEALVAKLGDAGIATVAKALTHLTEPIEEATQGN